MTVVKPHLPSLLWIWHPGLKFAVLPAAKMPLLRSAELMVTPGHCQGLGSSPALISGLLGADLQHTDTDTLLPQEGSAGVPRLSSGTGPKMSIFGTKTGGWRALFILICTGFFGACTQAEQIHGQVPAPFTALALVESANSHFSDPKHPSLKWDEIINLRNVHDFLLGCLAFFLLSWMLFKKNDIWFQGFSSFFSSQAQLPEWPNPGFSYLSEAQRLLSSRRISGFPALLCYPYSITLYHLGLQGAETS